MRPVSFSSRGVREGGGLGAWERSGGERADAGPVPRLLQGNQEAPRGMGQHTRRRVTTRRRAGKPPCPTASDSVGGRLGSVPQALRVTTCQICVSGGSAGRHAGNTTGHGGASLGTSQATQEQPAKVPNARRGPRGRSFSCLRLVARGRPHPAPTAHCPRALLSRSGAGGTMERRVSASAAQHRATAGRRSPSSPVTLYNRPCGHRWPRGPSAGGPRQ